MEIRAIIDKFLQNKKLAIAGVSHNPRKFGYLVFKTAKEKGYFVTPVNPKGGIIDGIPCVESVTNLSEDIHNLLITTHKKDTARVVEEAIAKGIRNIWIQNGCESDESIRIAREHNVQLVSGVCFLMYAWPKGAHKFHQTLTKWFGRYIKETKELKMPE